MTRRSPSGSDTLVNKYCSSSREQVQLVSGGQQTRSHQADTPLWLYEILIKNRVQPVLDKPPALFLEREGFFIQLS